MNDAKNFALTMPPTSQTAIVAAILPPSVTRMTKPTDFDAIQSIPFDDDVNHDDLLRSITSSTIAIDGDNTQNGNAHSHTGVLKKLTSYFSSSHKTLKNQNMHKQIAGANSNIDTCAVLSSSSSSLVSSVSSLSPTPSTSSSSLAAVAAAAAPAIADQVKSTMAAAASNNASTTLAKPIQSHTIHTMTNLNSINCSSQNRSCSCSSSLSANSMKMLCGDKRDVDKCDEILSKNKIINNNRISSKCLCNNKADKIDYGAIDGRASTTSALAALATPTETSAAAKARSTNKRVQKIDGSTAAATGESFTLPRAILRQR